MVCPNCGSTKFKNATVGICQDCGHKFTVSKG